MVKFDTVKIVCYHDEGDWHELPKAALNSLVGRTWSEDLSPDPGTRFTYLTRLFIILKRKQP